MVRSEDPRDGDHGSTPRHPRRPYLEAPWGLVLRGERPDLSPFMASLVPKTGGTSPVCQSAPPPVSKQKHGHCCRWAPGDDRTMVLGLQCDCGLAFLRCSDPDAGHGPPGPPPAPSCSQRRSTHPQGTLGASLCSSDDRTLLMWVTCFLSNMQFLGA